MADKISQYEQIIKQGMCLEHDGVELKPNLWENGVYWGADDFVYHLLAEVGKKGLKATILGKRPVGEYLRWVDGLYRPGEIPSASNAIHYRAARKLRELL
ncbi:MAG: hypothetical protein HY231_20615 [Acidobacteria bacterium]|nr:hypothetical protein [Acidobacteriota bacterium]